MVQTERNNMRATRAKDLAWLSCLLLGACNDGFLGYSFEPRCVGKKIRCEAPEPPAYRSLSIDPFEAQYLDTGDLSALTPVEVASDLCLGATFIGGQGSEVWVVCNEYSLTELRVRQYDGENLLSDFLLVPPPGLKGKKQVTGVGFLGHGSTPDGPYLGLVWQHTCGEPFEYGCSVSEIVRFTQDASEKPKRILLQDDVASTFESPRYVLVNEKGEMFWLGTENGNTSLGRVDAQGKVVWIQQGFPQDFSPEWYLSQAPLTFANGKVSVLGTLADGGLVTLDADPATGNLSGSRVYDDELARAVMSHDGDGALVLAYSDVRGDLHWLRAGKDDVTETVLVRQDYTLLHPNNLEVDVKGTHYLVSVTGPMDAPVLTLCRRKKNKDATCYVAPEGWVGESFWPEEWLELVPPEWLAAGIRDYNTELAFAAVSGDGSVYTLGKDKSLLRYRFPESDAK